MCGNSSELYSIVFIRWGKMCLSLFNIPIILEHLLDTFSECFFQFTCVSRVSPKKLNSSTFSRIVLLILGVSVFTFLLCMWNNINLVLAILSDSLFISSHSLILKSSSHLIDIGNNISKGNDTEMVQGITRSSLCPDVSVRNKRLSAQLSK